MNDAIIDRWNSVVSKNDTVFVLGDFSFKRPWALDHLNGHLHLVIGNHDSNHVIKNSRWESVSSYKEQKHNGVHFVLCHYPFESWRKSHHGSVHLHGHCHGDSSKMTNRWDVGVDVWDFAPVSFDWFINMRKEVGPDHHRRGE